MTAGATTGGTRRRRRVRWIAVASLVLSMTGLGLSAPVGAAGADARQERRTVKTLTLKRTSPAPVVTGSKVTFAGTAPRRLRGKRVVLQRRVGSGRWILTDRATVRRNRTFNLSGRATGVGRVQWRAIVSTARTLNRSRTLNTTVFRWYYVADLDPTDDSSYWDPASVVIGGKRYVKSVGMDNYWDAGEPEWADYNMRYRCVRFAAHIGLSNESESGAVAKFYISLDGARSHIGTKSLGAATKVERNVSTRLRIRLETIATTEDAVAEAYFGGARLLCSGHP